MTQRLLIFSIKEEPWRGAWREEVVVVPAGERP